MSVKTETGSGKKNHKPLDKTLPADVVHGSSATYAAKSQFYFVLAAFFLNEYVYMNM